MTSIEWLEKKMKLSLGNEFQYLVGFFVLAKEMHKQEIEDAFQDGKWDWSEHITNGKESKDLAQYYLETFKID